MGGGNESLNVLADALPAGSVWSIVGNVLFPLNRTSHTPRPPPQHYCTCTGSGNWSHSAHQRGRHL